MRRIIILWLSLLIAFASGFAQNQNCGLEDRWVYEPNEGTFSFELEVSGYLSGVLGVLGQGVCAAELAFLSQSTRNLEIWLESPAGTRVQLIGPNIGPATPPTLNSKWDISFVRCAVEPEPMPTYASRWTNDQPSSLAVSGTGSYHPYNGCLENFNSGPVNGTWRVLVRFDPTQFEIFPNFIYHFRIVFCDETGPLCCFAEAGDLVNASKDILACENDPSLLLKPQTSYAFAIRPDPAEYGFRYLLERDGRVAELLEPVDGDIDLRAYPAGEYRLCGFSYRLTDLPLITTLLNTLSLEALRQSLLGDAPLFCGDLSVEEFEIRIVAPPEPTRIDTTICQGETFEYDGVLLDASGEYSFTYTTEAGCDGLVVVDLRVAEPAMPPPIDREVCHGESYAFGARNLDASGQYVEVFQTVEGCDSTVVLNLTVLPPLVSNLDTAICFGESFEKGTQTFSAPGDYSVTLTSVGGCDSTVNIRLAVFRPQAVIAAPATLTCASERATLDGGASTPAGALSYAWTNQAGDPLGAGATLQVDRAGIYRLRVTQTAGELACASPLVSVEVLENKTLPSADAGPSFVLTCETTQATLGGAGTSAGGDFTYQWTTSNGNILSGAASPNAAVDAPGAYTLRVVDTRNGCAAEDEVSVAADQRAPYADAGPARTLTCQETQTRLDGSNSDPGLRYSWRSTTGVIPQDANTLAPLVDQPGRYELTIVDPGNGCQSVDAVDVNSDEQRPNVRIAPPPPLTCERAFVTLNTSGTDSAPNYLIEWTASQGGRFQSPADENSLSPTVTAPGLYQLSVTNPDNGCGNSASVVVEENIVTVVADPGQGGILNCAQPTLTLDGRASSPASDSRFAWSSVDGNIVSDPNQAVVTIDAPGSYLLTVRDESSGCTDSQSVRIDGDFDPPSVAIAAPPTLNCATTRVVLDGGASSAGPDIAYSWSGPCVVAGADSRQAAVDCPGTYILRLSDLSNGCSAEAQVLVERDDDSPGAEVAAPEASLDCETGAALLDGGASRGGLIEWQLEGETLSAEPQFSARTPGRYLLIVTNSQGCADTAVVNVTLDCQPEAVVVDPGVFDCRTDFLRLDGGASTSGANITYQWLAETPECLIDGADTPRPRIRCGGQYTFIVTHTLFQLSDTLVVNVPVDADQPQAVVNAPGPLTCDNPSATLDGGGSTEGPDLRYFWVDANEDTIAATLVVEVDQPGVYLFEVFNTRNGCRDVDFVVVDEDGSLHRVSFGATLFPCGAASFALQAFVTPDNPAFQYQWEGPAIEEGADRAEAIISAPGEYRLRVLNPANGCAVEKTVTVGSQSCAPCLVIAPPETLSCARASIRLDAQLCAPCAGCTLSWSSADGNIASGADTATPLVDAPGQYTLTATDPQGFSTTVSVRVRAEREPPEIDPGPGQNLTCADEVVRIGLAPAPGQEFDYQWSSADGLIVSAADEPIIVAAREGRYTLNITDRETGCVASADVIVGVDTLPPVAEAGPQRELTCTATIVNLDAGGSSFGANIAYSWSAAEGGNILAGANSPSPAVNAAGLYLLSVTNTSNGCVAIDSVRVRQSGDLPPLPPLADATLTCADASVTLEGAAPDPVNYSYSWCRLDAQGEPVECRETLSLIAEEPGRFRFSVTDTRSACVNSATVLVSQDFEPPAVDAGAAVTLGCDTPSRRLSGAAGPAGAALSYAWSANDDLPVDEANTLTPLVYAPGLYFLTATNLDNGCAATDSVEVRRDAAAPELSIEAPAALTCAEARATLRAVARSNSGQLRYSWSTLDGRISGSAEGPSVVVSAPGRYDLMVTDPVSGCQAMTFVTLDGNADAPQALVDNTDELALTCQRASVTLDAGPSLSADGSALRFEWTTLSGAPFIGGSDERAVRAEAPGLHRLIVTQSSNGCRDTLDVQVIRDSSPPRIRIAQPAPITCAQRSVIIDASASEQGPGLRYQWFDGGGAPTGAGAATLAVMNGGTYTLRVVNDNNGCENTASARVNVDTLPPAARIAPPDHLDCATRSVTLDGSASTASGVTYNWLFAPGNIVSGQSSPAALVNSPGQYTLVVRNRRNGCAASASVIVEERGSDIEAVFLSVEQPDCSGLGEGAIRVDSVRGGEGPYLYALNEGAFGGIAYFSRLTPGVYRLRVQDSNGCEWDGSAAVDDPSQATVDLGADLLVNLGDSVTLEARVRGGIPDRITWMPAGLFADPNAPTQVVRPLETTTYRVMVDIGGCLAFDEVTITVAKRRPVFAPTAFSPNGDGVNDIFLLYTGEDVREIKSFSIFDRWGMMLYRAGPFPPNDPNFGWDGRFRGQLMNPAVFVFFAEVEFIDGRVEMVKGDFALLR